MLGKIIAMQNNGLGCTARNNTLAGYCNMKSKNAKIIVSQRITRLKNLGYIVVEYINNNRRTIRINNKLLKKLVNKAKQMKDTYHAELLDIMDSAAKLNKASEELLVKAKKLYKKINPKKGIKQDNSFELQGNFKEFINLYKGKKSIADSDLTLLQDLYQDPPLSKGMFENKTAEQKQVLVNKCLHGYLQVVYDKDPQFIKDPINFLTKTNETDMHAYWKQNPVVKMEVEKLASDKLLAQERRNALEQDLRKATGWISKEKKYPKNVCSQSELIATVKKHVKDDNLVNDWVNQGLLDFDTWLDMLSYDENIQKIMEN